MSAPPRDGFLDAVRAIAVVRVVIWHTFATAAISWSVASMPAMFFVAGSLLARAVDRKTVRDLYLDRLRRLLLPFWVFAGVMLATFAFVHELDGTPSTAIGFRTLLPWIVPLADPHASRWEAGWITTPLWYLRCYLWLVLLSPLIRPAQRRFGPAVLIVPVVGVFVVDHLIRTPELAPDVFSAVQWYAGDLVTYSFFLVLGFFHRDGLIARLSTRDRLEWAGVSAAAAFLWLGVIDVPGNVVNNSYPLLLFVGCAWLGLFLAAEHWIASLVVRPSTGPAIRWLGRRSMTVYLWHTTAIVGAYWVRATFAPGTPRAVVLPLVALGVVVLGVAFGWVEDLTAHRRAESWPGRAVPVHRLPAWMRSRSTVWRGAAAGLALGVLVTSFVVPSGGSSGSAAATGSDTETDDGSGDGGGLALPPAPSAKPEQADFGEAPAVTAAPEATPAPAVTAAPDAAAAPAQTAAPETAAVDTATASAGRGVAALRGTPAVADDGLAARVQTVVDEWRAEHDVDGVRAGIMLADGTTTTATAGTAVGGGTLSAADVVPVTSATKTFTSAIVMRLVDGGLIGLDDPLPVLDAAPDFPFAGKVTIRQLLAHTSGIVTYTEAGAFAGHEGDQIDVLDTLAFAGAQDLQWVPGTAAGYSATGYMVLGLLAEQLSGRSYEELVADVAGDAGLTATSLDPVPRAGWVGFSAGGLQSNVTDLLAWGQALYGRGAIVSEAALGAITDIDNDFSSGLGAYPTCPCQLDAQGRKVYTAIGHNGGEVTVQYAPAIDASIAVSLTESMWTSELSTGDVAKLVAALAAAAAGPTS